MFIVQTHPFMRQYTCTHTHEIPIFTFHIKGGNNDFMIERTREMEIRSIVSGIKTTI